MSNSRRVGGRWQLSTRSRTSASHCSTPYPHHTCWAVEPSEHCHSSHRSYTPHVPGECRAVCAQHHTSFPCTRSSSRQQAQAAVMEVVRWAMLAAAVVAYLECQEATLEVATAEQRAAEMADPVEALTRSRRSKTLGPAIGNCSEQAYADHARSSHAVEAIRLRRRPMASLEHRPAKMLPSTFLQLICVQTAAVISCARDLALLRATVPIRACAACVGRWICIRAIAATSAIASSAREVSAR